MTDIKKQSLSGPRQRLVELMQETYFGRIDGLVVSNGEPVFEPEPLIARDILFGRETGARCKRSDNFSLKNQVVELFRFFDRERTLKIESLTIQNGLPFRMTVAA